MLNLKKVTYFKSTEKGKNTHDPHFRSRHPLRRLSLRRSDPADDQHYPHSGMQPLLAPLAELVAIWLIPMDELVR
jgi:hypothetical protein